MRMDWTLVVVAKAVARFVIFLRRAFAVVVAAATAATDTFAAVVARALFILPIGIAMRVVCREDERREAGFFARCAASAAFARVHGAA